MKNIQILLIIILVSSCVSNKILNNSHLAELDYLLSNPISESNYNVIYKKYNEEWTNFDWDSLTISVENYDYRKLDSLLQPLTIYSDEWKVEELEYIYSKFETNFFDKYDSYLKIKRYTLGSEGDYVHLLDDAIGLVRDIDYILYARKKYNESNFKNSLEIFKEECELRKDFKNKLSSKDWENASFDLDREDYLNSKSYRYHLQQYNIALFCGRYTMLDKFVKDNSEHILSESIKFWEEKELVADIKNAYLQEFNYKTFNQNWKNLLNSSLDDYLISLVKKSNIYSKTTVETILLRGHDATIEDLYFFDSRSSNVFQNHRLYPKPFTFYQSSENIESKRIIRDLISVDLENYCLLDSITQRNLKMISNLEWNDNRIDSLIIVRENNPCKNN